MPCIAPVEWKSRFVWFKIISLALHVSVPAWTFASPCKPSGACDKFIFSLFKSS
uniref:Uncharacterized protein n=1 Tax=Anguilla anguilla TaxID=7936 RepID=A0A0E9TNU9_ANGAN